MGRAAGFRFDSRARFGAAGLACRAAHDRPAQRFGAAQTGPEPAFQKFEAAVPGTGNSGLATASPAAGLPRRTVGFCRRLGHGRARRAGKPGYLVALAGQPGRILGARIGTSASPGDAGWGVSSLDGMRVDFSPEAGKRTAKEQLSSVLRFHIKKDGVPDCRLQAGDDGRHGCNPSLPHSQKIGSMLNKVRISGRNKAYVKILAPVLLWSKNTRADLDSSLPESKPTACLR